MVNNLYGLRTILLNDLYYLREIILVPYFRFLIHFFVFFLDPFDPFDPLALSV